MVNVMLAVRSGLSCVAQTPNDASLAVTKYVPAANGPYPQCEMFHHDSPLQVA